MRSPDRTPTSPITPIPAAYSHRGTYYLLNANGMIIATIVGNGAETTASYIADACNHYAEYLQEMDESEHHRTEPDS